MSLTERDLRIAYYDASDGPRIMLFGPKDVDLRPLQECLIDLSRGGGPYHIESLPFARAFGGVEVELVAIGSLVSAQEIVPTQGLVRISATRPRFRWRRSCMGWDYLARLVQGLIASPRSGHQYLTRYPNEDAIVVVSKGEYGDAVLEMD